MSRVVVIDNGGNTIKAGYAGEHAPRAVFPALVGEPRNKGVVMATGDKEYYVGDLAQEKRGCLHTSRPIQDRVITNWKDAERLWAHTFYQELKIVPEDSPVLLTEPPLNPPEKRETTMEILFERFGVPGAHLSIGSVLSLYSAGNTTGLVVDSGRDLTTTVPIYEGYTLTRHINKTKIAGHAITDFLVQLLSEKGYGFTTSNEIDIVNYIKETVCYVAGEYADAQADVHNNPSNVVKYPLPDGQDIVLNEERFKCTELMFDPTMMQVDPQANGLDKMCFDSIISCDAEIRKCLYEYTVLSGGNTLFDGLAKRVAGGIHSLYKQRYPNEPVVPIKVTDDVSRMYSTWLGGSMLGVLQMFGTMLVNKQDYMEHGSQIVHTKCF